MRAVRRGFAVLGLTLATSFLLACSPKYDWREVHGSNSPFSATLPAKASEYTRPVQLGTLKTEMTMTAAQVDGATYAIGTAVMPDAKLAQEALSLMKQALVANIDGKIVREQGEQKPYPYLHVEARGHQQLYGNSKKVLLLARFVAHENRIYQVIAAGEEKPAMREAADTLFSSFKPN